MRQSHLFNMVSMAVLIPWLAVNTITAFQIQISFPSLTKNHQTSWKQSRYHSPQTSLTQPNQRFGKTALNDLSEWRDLFFEETQKPPSVNQIMQEKDLEGPARELCVFPFSLSEILIQGETKELCLYEDRFHQLFEKAQASHAGVVAMGLIAPPAGILQVMPLCEIEAFTRMPGQTEFGTDFCIMATIRVVGRASLIHVVEEDVLEGIEYLKGWCVEMNDEMNVVGSGSSDAEENKDERMLKSGNEIAKLLEVVMDSIIELEDQLAVLDGGEAGDEGVLNDDDDEKEDEEEDDDDDDELDTRRSRFERAYQIAKSTDMQGYKTTSESDEKNNRSIQDLTALSWAYFSTEENPEDIFIYKLRAMECDDLCERLQIALKMLKERRSKLKAIMKGLVSKDYGEDEGENL